MNHTDNIKYIKSILFKTYIKDTHLIKHNIADNLHNKYKLRTPAIHELYLTQWKKLTRYYRMNLSML